jgi:transcriptional regulator with XRE-family HTH domain
MATKDFSKRFSETVRKHRKQKKISQETLAERGDISAKMVAFVERNERIPSILIAEKIAHGLGVPLWRLVKDAEDN